MEIKVLPAGLFLAEDVRGKKFDAVSPESITPANGVRFDWEYQRDREYPHLNRIVAKYHGCQVSIRLLAGCDFNRRMEESGEPKRHYQVHLSFPIGEGSRYRSLGLIDRWSIGMDKYRESFLECVIDVEDIVIDLCVAMSKPG